MVDAISFSGSYQRSAVVLHERQASAAAEIQPALSALAALAVSAPASDMAEADNDLPDSFGIVYGASGRPEGVQAPAYAVPAAQATTDDRLANNRNPSARLAMESTQLNALLSSLMTPGVSSDAGRPVENTVTTTQTTDNQLSRMVQQSVVAQLYSQF
jgi:hypothetical protein